MPNDAQYTKEWYKKAWQREKKRSVWYESAYRAQNSKVKELKTKIVNLEGKIKKEGYAD